LYPEVRNLLLVNLVQNYRNRLIFAKVIAKKFTGSFYGPPGAYSQGMARVAKATPNRFKKKL